MRKDEKMKKIYSLKKSMALIGLVVAVVCFGLFASTRAAFAWNFTVSAEEIKPQNGVFTFPVSAFADGKARFFEFKASPTDRIRFFVVKSTDGVVRAAFDACDKCFRSLKGYSQQGDNMICINCGLKFRTDKVNIITGGCNPSALSRTIQGDKVVITQQDVLEGLRFFK
jgi:uncharacterized membrane protein